MSENRLPRLKPLSGQVLYKSLYEKSVALIGEKEDFSFQQTITCQSSLNEQAFDYDRITKKQSDGKFITERSLEDM